MDDARARRAERAKERLANQPRACTFTVAIGGISRAEPLAGQTVCERLPHEILHDEIVGSILVTDVMEGADVRMIERRDGAGFMFESRAELRVGCEGLREHFDCDRALEARIARLIHLSHPAGPNGQLDFVGPETRAGAQ
jgi:hypothetical protein